MVILHSKDIYYVLKREADGISELMVQFGFSSEEELFETIKKVAPSKAKDFIKDLKKQRKNFNKRFRVPESVVESVKGETNNNAAVHYQEYSEEEHVEIEVVQLDKCETEFAEVECNRVEPDVENVYDYSMYSLEEAKKLDKETSGEICECEIKHKGFVSKRRECCSRLVFAKNALLELRRLAKIQEENIEAISIEYEECASAMREINLERKAKTKKLEAIRARILELEKITIFVFSDGTIDIENADIPFIGEAQVMNKFNELIFRPEVMEFSITAKQIKTIAELLLMIEEFRKVHSAFEVEFDSEELQRFYETVVSK